MWSVFILGKVKSNALKIPVLVIICWVFVYGAFEYSIPLGANGGIGAGCAVDDWQHGFGINPALLVRGERIGVGVTYANPYGLPGVQCGNAGFKAKWGRFSSGFGFTTLGVDGYDEYNIQLGLAGEVISHLDVGINIHALAQNVAQEQGDIVFAVDAGILWEAERFKLGIAGAGLNGPRLSNGELLPSSFRIGGCWNPVSGLLLAGDIYRENGIDMLLAGVEISMFPEVKIRAGVQTFPLSYCGGIGFKLNWLGLNYSYRFHPQLEGSHILGVFCEWN